MNRHLKLAILVAPFLALGGYIAAGYFASDTDPGKPALPLVTEGPCLPYDKGCLLKGIRLVLKLQIDRQDGKGLSISTSRPLEGVTLQIVDDRQTSPRQLQQINPLLWRLTSSEPIASSTRIRIAAAARNAHYFGEISLGEP
ncbi:MAG TPA: hypothetical protein EYH03_00955 [Chromatiales bacterium]|nr:hypothetical protein [Chromatiales bacterium]